MPLTGFIHRVPGAMACESARDKRKPSLVGRIRVRALSLLGGVLASSCTIELTGTETYDLPQATTWDAGRDEDAVAQVVEAPSCAATELTLAPRPAAMFLLIDQSSSMFEQGYWEPIKARVLDAVSQYEHEVLFGLATYTGEHEGECPALQVSAEPARHNAAAIQRAYEQLREPGYKGETPTAAALWQMALRLRRLAPDKAKFVLLVTDGDPDFCDDGDPTCARDAVVAAAQAAHAQGVTTLVVGVGSDVARDHLADVANAGSGEAVAQRGRAHEECGRSGATYAESGGDAPFYEITAAQSQDVLADVLAGIRSCSFDLEDEPGASLPEALVVELDGQRLSRDDPDGFRVNGATELELLGLSCRRWRTPEARISIMVPCSQGTDLGNSETEPF